MKEEKAISKTIKKEVIEKVCEHKENNASKSAKRIGDTNNIKSVKEKYYYDFNSDELKYCRVVYYIDTENENVIIDEPYEESINLEVLN